MSNSIHQAQQEILLVTGSRFTDRQYTEKESSEKGNNASKEDQLREACWNGLIKEMLPELFFMHRENVTLFLWQMRDANRLLVMEMANLPMQIDQEASIDPYYFMEHQGYS